MKKILTFAMAILCASPLFAQNADKIIAQLAQKASQNINMNFKETRISADKSKTVNLTGKLVFKPEGFLSMEYDNGDLFLIDGNTVKINKNGKSQVYDASKNLMFKGLSHLLVYAFQGRLEELSKEQQTTLLVNVEGSEYVAILAAEKKATRGYSRAIFHYDAKNCRIRTMELVEFSGAVTTYAL